MLSIMAGSDDNGCQAGVTSFGFAQDRLCTTQYFGFMRCCRDSSSRCNFAAMSEGDLYLEKFDGINSVLR
jgi:hypothetical protein